MGNFTKAERELRLAREHIDNAFDFIERLRVMFKNTPQGEIENIRQRLNKIEERWE